MSVFQLCGDANLSQHKDKKFTQEEMNRYIERATTKFNELEKKNPTHTKANQIQADLYAASCHNKDSNNGQKFNKWSTFK